MDRIFYSASTGGFYHEIIHGDAVPEDAREVNRERYDELMVGQSSGLVIVPGEAGVPTSEKPSRRNLPAAEQIHALEAAITPRRLREAIMGTDNGWLKAQEAAIATLRKKKNSK